MVTHRKAKVRIENRTGQQLNSVSVGHKYSDDYKNEHTWEGPINTGSKTNESMLVDYHTGVLTTGRDWWVVSWVTADGDVYLTNPTNFRGLIDFGEKVVSTVSGPLAELGTLLVAPLLVADPSKISAVATASVAVTAGLISTLCNSESTKGFKQHILRSEDAEEFTTIVIENDKVRFESKSGNSETGVTVTKAAEYKQITNA